jgi:hypothetical protein
MLELRSMPASEGVRQFIPWIVALGFAYATLGCFALRRLGKLDLLLLLAPLLALVPALGILGNLVGRGFVYRYVSWSLVSYALVLGAGASDARRSWLARLAVATLVVVNCISIYNRRFDERYAEEDYRAVVARLDELDPQRRPLLSASHYTAAALRYYIGDTRPLASLPIYAEQVEDRDRQIATFLDVYPPGTTFWIVSEWLPADDVRRTTRDAVLAKFDAKLVDELHQAEIYSAVVP